VDEFSRSAVENHLTVIQTKFQTKLERAQIALENAEQKLQFQEKKMENLSIKFEELRNHRPELLMSSHNLSQQNDSAETIQLVEKLRAELQQSRKEAAFEKSFRMKVQALVDQLEQTQSDLQKENIHLQTLLNQPMSIRLEEAHLNNEIEADSNRKKETSTSSKQEYDNVEEISDQHPHKKLALSNADDITVTADIVCYNTDDQNHVYQNGDSAEQSFMVTASDFTMDVPQEVNAVSDGIEFESELALSTRSLRSILAYDLPNNIGRWLLMLAAGTGIALMTSAFRRHEVSTTLNMHLSADGSTRGLPGIVRQLLRGSTRGQTTAFSFGEVSATNDGSLKFSY